MTTNAKKISELNETQSATADDFVVIVDDPNNIPSTKKITVQNLFGNSSANVKLTSLSPANSTMTAIKAGVIFYDQSYLYIAVANNVVKRVALSLF